MTNETESKFHEYSRRPFTNRFVISHPLSSTEDKITDEESPPQDVSSVGDAFSPSPTIRTEKVEGVKEVKKDFVVAKEPASNTPTQQPIREENNRKKLAPFIWILALIVVVLAITLPLTLRDDDDNEELESSSPPPAEVDFITGISLVTHYAVNATINSRLARTVISIDVMNSLPCVSIRGVTLQLPEGARVAKVDFVDNEKQCSVHGKAMELAQARKTFMDQAAQGMGGAYVEERDSFTYSLQVSMAPLGKTSVQVVVEQLLKQKVGVVDFQVPLVPLQKVDQVFFDLHIDDATPEAREIEVDLDLIEQIQNETSFHMELLDAQDYDLPLLIKGSYKPGHLPDEGVLYTKGNCFEHVFHPSTVQAMPKNIIFLIDISQSMRHNNKLVDAKYALKNLTSRLTAEDTMTIQAFAGKSTEELKGLFYATPEEKTEALEWIDEKLTFRSGGTNLFAALGQALLRAETAKNINPPGVTVLVILSDGRPTIGETSVSRIADVVRQLNDRVQAKIFSLGFHEASLDLLKAISIMNDGATYTLGPQANFANEMIEFFDSEFGTILASDIEFVFTGDKVNHTKHKFPLLSKGTEIVVRGLLSDGLSASNDLTVQVTGHTRENAQDEWQPQATEDPFVTTDMPDENSRCHQSYAHDKITQLLDLAHASRIVGDHAVAPLVDFSDSCPPDSTLEECIRGEALLLALHANLVVAGLTGMVTHDEEGKCLTTQDQVEICVDGTDPSGENYWENPWEDTVNGDGPGDGGFWDQQSTAAPAGWSGTASAPHMATVSWFIVVSSLFVSWFMPLVW